MDTEKFKTFCEDCVENQYLCNKNPLDCAREEGAELYFKLYEKLIYIPGGAYRRREVS